MPHKKLARKKIYQSPWVNLYVDKVQLKDGRVIEKHHYLDLPKDAIGVVATNNYNEILLAKIERYITNNVGWEVPGGAVDTGEKILDAAKREFKEETGFGLINHQLIHSYYPNNGISNATFHIVFGEVTNQGSKFDSNEVDEINFFPQKQVAEMIDSGSVTNGLSLTALLLFLHRQVHKRRNST